MGKIYYKDVSYGGGGSSTLDGSIVGVEQVQRSGNLIAVISVDEDDTNIYSPLPPLIDVDVNDVSVLDSVTQTAKVYTHKSLTKAEYEAIPSSISHVNNIIYAITDEPKLYLNGIEYNGTGGGQTSVIVSPIATEGTKIASISVDGIINDIYAPNGGDEYVAGDNIVISTFSGQPSTISAVNTTYSAFTSTAAGLVPPPTTAVDMFLKSDGTWSEAGVGNVVDVYENGVSVLDENNIAQTHSYKEITQAEYDALYPPGSTVTDNILYAIKDGEGGGGSGGGGNVDDVYVNGVSVLDSNHIAQIKTHKEITASDYNELTTEQKNDGTLYLINGTSGITVQVEDISIGKYIESAYVCQDEVTEDGTGVISYYYDGSQIGNDFWLTDKVDVTNYTYIKYDLELGTCYGTSSSNWYYTVGLMSSIPSNWYYAGDSRYAVKNSYTNQERSYTDETLDVSNLTGEYYIIVVAHGWNATLDNIRLVSENIQPNRIYFMDTEFGNNSGGSSGGETKTNIFTNSSTSNPATITFSKPITDYDFITFQIRAGSNALATMTYDTSNLIVGDTIGAGFYTGVFAWYYLTDMQTLTYRVDAGGAYISNITGIKLGEGGISDLDDLSNVDITTPSDGQVLQYDSANSKWINATPSGGGGYTKTLLYDAGSNTSYAPYNQNVQLLDDIDNYDELLMLCCSAGDGGLSAYTVFFYADAKLAQTYKPIYTGWFKRTFTVDFSNRTYFRYSGSCEGESNRQPYIYKIYGIKY